MTYSRVLVLPWMSTLDVVARSLLDHEHHVDPPRLRATTRAKGCVGEGKTEPFHLQRQRFATFVEQAGIEGRTGTRCSPGTQPLRINPSNMGLQIDIAEAIGFALVDDEGQLKAPVDRIIFGARLGHAGVGIAMVAVVLPKQLAVVLNPARVVDVRMGEKAQYIRRGRIDDSGQLASAERVIADEIDLPHRGFIAFSDREDKVNRIVTARDRLRHNLDVAATNVPVKLHDAACVCLHRRALERLARFRLDEVG